MQKIVRPASVFFTLGCGVFALVGCASYKADDGGRHADIQDNITPELYSLHQRQIDVDDEIWRTWDANKRMFWADLQREWLHDRPSRLSVLPSPY
jgi:hypothetical protein